jgi:copper chaperone CopZ
MVTTVYPVSDVHCDNCVAALERALLPLPGVDHVRVDLEHGTVAVTGVCIEDAAVRAAIDEAGYDVG